MKTNRAVKNRRSAADSRPGRRRASNVEKANGDWVSVQEAAAVLGVHPGTVRIWSDKGLLPVYRTHGGHRRYRRSEVELWASSARGAQDIDPASVVQAAVRNIRLQISEGRLVAEPWYQKLDADARAQYRESARSLLHGLMNYLSAGSEAGGSEARSIGYEYASRARRFGLNRVDATRAFLFFREALLKAVVEVYQAANVPSAWAWGEILLRVNAFSDLILLNLQETYQALQKMENRE